MKPIAATVIGITLSAGMAAEVELEQRTWGPPVDLGAPLENISIQHCVIGLEEGEPAAYFTVAGQPAVFNILGLLDYRLIGAFPLPGADRAWSHAVATDGAIYVAGVGSGASGHLYRYRPGSGAVEDLGAPVPGHKFLWALAADDRGGVFGGTWEGGHVFHFDATNASFRDYGRIDPNEDYIRSIAWHEGTVYAGSGARNGRVWRLDPETGSRSRIEIPVRPEYADQIDHMRSAYHLAVAGHHLFAFFAGPRVMLAYDLQREEWWEETYRNIRGPVTGIASSDDTSFFFVNNTDGFVRLDLASRRQTPAAPFNAAFRGGGWVNLAEETDFPGETLVTVHGDGSTAFLNFSSGKSRTLPALVRGAETPLQSLETGPDGALYLSGYMGSTGARFDPVRRETTVFPVGQAEGIAALGNTVYWGIYPGARIFGQPVAEGPLSRPREIFQVGHHQDRPFAMTAGEGRLFIGTIPDYGRLGGALAVFTPDGNGGGLTVYPEVVKHQSIVGLAWHPSGRLFGSTSVAGGLGIDPAAPAARLFVWDVEKGKVLREWSPDLPGAEQAPMIGGLSLGPDGEIWGAMNGVVFVLDPETLEIRRHRNLYPEVSRYGRWRPVHFRWGSDGLLYTNLAGRITVIDPATLAFRDLGARSGLIALDAADNLYYASGPRLMQIPAHDRP